MADVVGFSYAACQVTLHQDDASTVVAATPARIARNIRSRAIQTGPRKNMILEPLEKPRPKS